MNPLPPLYKVLLAIMAAALTGAVLVTIGAALALHAPDLPPPTKPYRLALAGAATAVTAGVSAALIAFTIILHTVFHKEDLPSIDPHRPRH